MSHDQRRFWHRIVTNTHYFVCHISRAINLKFYYLFEIYPCNKTNHINFMLQKQFVLFKAGENCIVVIRFNSLINPICVGARPIIRVEVMQFIWTLPNITRCIPPSVFVINFPYIQGVDTQVGSGALESLINCHQADIYFPITNSIGWETCYLNLDWEMISIAHNTQCHYHARRRHTVWQSYKKTRHRLSIMKRSEEKYENNGRRRGTG